MRKINRVKRNEDFQKIIGHKRYVSNDIFVLYYQKGKTDHLRVGISVGKKLGNAVHRNKIKRQLRMMLMELTNKTVPIDLIVIVRNKYLNKNYSENRKDLLLVLKKVKMNEYDILNSKEIIDENFS